MTELQTRILAAMPPDHCVSASWIAFATGATPEAAQTALHDLDDGGHVMLRNGLYRLSAVAVAAREAHRRVAEGQTQAVEHEI